MAFDFDQIFKDALKKGLDAARPGGKAAQQWVKESADANRDTLDAIAQAVLDKALSKETAEDLFKESTRAMHAEAAALSVILKAAAQAGMQAFTDALSKALSAGLKLAL
jgi:hypothetical protein